METDEKCGLQWSRRVFSTILCRLHLDRPMLAASGRCLGNWASSISTKLALGATDRGTRPTRNRQSNYHNQAGRSQTRIVKKGALPGGAHLARALLIEWNREHIISQRPANDGASFAAELELKLIAPVGRGQLKRGAPVVYRWPFGSRTNKGPGKTANEGAGLVTLGLCRLELRRQVYDYICIDCSQPDLGPTGIASGRAHYRRPSGDKCARARPCRHYGPGQRHYRLHGLPGRPLGADLDRLELVGGPGGLITDRRRRRAGPAPRPSRARLLLALALAATLGGALGSNRAAPGRPSIMDASIGAPDSARLPDWPAPDARKGPRALNNNDGNGLGWPGRSYNDDDDDNNDNNSASNYSNYANEIHDNYYNNSSASNHNGLQLAADLGPANKLSLGWPAARDASDKLAPDKIDKGRAELDWAARVSLDDRQDRAPASPLSHSDHVKRSAPEVATRRDRLRVGRGHLSAPSWAMGAGGLQAAPGCPPECACNWKNGKQFADCSRHRNRLARIPSGLDPLTQVLNLSANHLVNLPPEAFSSLQLNNLQRIYLSG